MSSDRLGQVKRVLGNAGANVQHLAERIQAELEFAEALCSLHPGRASEWRPLLADAAARVEAEFASDPERAVTKAEEILVPLGKEAKSYTIYCIGHAHIDMNWLWSWPETVAVTTDTFGTVLRLMEEFPEFHFSQSQASVYALIEQYQPELLQRIARRVREGRWEVTASHWVENDKNLAGGEALCRHLLYTRRYMQTLFNLKPEDVPIDWSPDTFGHAATVPTYLARGGVKYLYLHRPGTWGEPRPRAFRWRAPDGSAVLVHNDMDLGYNGQIAPYMVQHLVNFARETGLRFRLFVYGVGDHGGGPTRRDLLRGRDMNTWPLWPKLVFSTARTYFERLEREGKKLATLDQELNFEFTGCYTTQTLIKKANRFGETKLADAETAAAVTWAALEAPYAGAAFEQGWRDTLFSHFHDILPGSGVHDTRTYCHGLFQKTMAMTSQEETRALRLLAARVDTTAAGPVPEDAEPASRVPTALGSGVGYRAGDGALSQAEGSAGRGHRPFVLFNPTAQVREELVEVTVWDNVYGWRRQELNTLPFSVKGPDGSVVAAQTVEVGNFWGHDFVRLAFPARVEPFGYARYIVMEQAGPEVKGGAAQLGRGHTCHYSFYERSPEGLENELVRLDIDPATGGIRTLVDKRTGLALIAADGAPALEYAVERPHGMTAWCIDHTGPAEAAQLTGLTRKLKGPHTATLEARLKVHASDFTLTYELRAGDPNLYLHLAGTWFERGTPQTGIPVLRAAFPLNLRKPEASYEIPFGAVDRDLPNGEEVPALRWAMVSGETAPGKAAGCLLLNDSKHGHSLAGSTLRLTLIRSSYDPDPLPEIGRHEVHLALRPFAGDLPVADAIRAGLAFNQGLRAIGTDVHKGDLPAAAGAVETTPDDVILSTVKKAEDEDALILRFFDPTGRTVTAKATLNADFLGKVASVTEVDLLERPLKLGSTAKAVGNVISVRLPARGIASVLVKLKR